MSKDTCFGLVDCNNFYASCERIFRPDLAGKPIVVLSNNDGCIIARSAEVKALGIEMAIPYHKVKDICEANDVQVFSSNYAFYGDISERVMRIITDAVPHSEIYSIDEVFIDLSHIAVDQLESFCQRLIQQVKRSIGVDISIGVGATKTQAKLANHLAKTVNKGPYVHLHDMKDYKPVLKHVAAQNIWGIGTKSALKLRQMGVYSVLDFMQMDRGLVRKMFKVIGVRTYDELYGIHCLALDDITTPRKHILSSRCFGRPTGELSDILEAVSMYTTRAYEKLREQESACSAIYVKLRTNPFARDEDYYNKSTVIELDQPTDDLFTLIKATKLGMQELFELGRRYKKASVMLLGIIPKGAIGLQADLLTPIKAVSQKSQRLLETMDRLNKRYGKHTTFSGSLGVKRPWMMQSNLRSPEYTSDWKDICVVK